MLKSYDELSKIDVMPFCDTRDKIPYLNWLKCRELLYKHGAEKVEFKPVKNTDGTFLFPQAETVDKNGRKTHSYFVSVSVKIDGNAYALDYPLISGNIPIFDDTLHQLRIDNAHKRAYVKCVAIETGLGINLWLKEDLTDTEDLSIHNIYSIQKRIEEKITYLLKRGITEDELYQKLGVGKKQVATILTGYIRNIYALEQGLDNFDK